MVLSVESWSLEGVDLADLGAYIIENREGWDVQPGRRGEPVAIPYRHGAYTVPKKYLDANTFVLTIVCAERLQGGALNPAGVYVGMQENQDRLAGLLYSDNLLDLRRGMADGTERQAVVEMIVATPWTQRGFNQMQINAMFVNSESTWRQLPQNANVAVIPNCGDLFGTINVGGNGPVGDLVLVATAVATGGPYQITINGVTATIATVTVGDKVVIDSGLRTVTLDTGGGPQPADATVKLDRANWFELEEAQANLIYFDESQVSIQASWYDRWL